MEANLALITLYGCLISCRKCSAFFATSSFHVSSVYIRGLKFHVLCIGPKVLLQFHHTGYAWIRGRRLLYNSDSMSFGYYRLNLGCFYLFMRDRLSRTCFLFEKSILNMGSLTVTCVSAPSTLIVLNPILYHNRYCLLKEELLLPLPQLQ